MKLKKKKLRTKRTLIINSRKTQLKFLRHRIRKEGMESLTLIGHIECKRNRGKIRINFLTDFGKCMAEQGFTRDSKRDKNY